MSSGSTPFNRKASIAAGIGFALAFVSFLLGVIDEHNALVIPEWLIVTPFYIGALMMFGAIIYILFTTEWPSR